MELSIIITIFVTATAGFAGGLVFAFLFDLSEERRIVKRRKRKQLRDARRQALRAEATRRMEKMRTIYIDNNWKI